MNIIVINDGLKNGLGVVSRVSSNHSTLPILKDVLIEAKKGLISLTSTNLEIGTKYTLSGKVVKEGSVAVPVDVLGQIVSNLSGERVELIAEGTILNVSTENYRADVQGAPVDEFPELPTISNTKNYIEIDSAVLKSALEVVLSAAQFSELRPELSSVYFQFLDDKIVLVSTDSFRLSEKTLADDQFKSTISGEFKILLPLRTAQELVRVLGDKDVVKIYRDPNQILFKTDKVEMISRLLEGTFPDYRAIIPKDYQAEVSVDRDEFLSAVKLSGVMSGASSEVVLRPAASGSLEVFSRDDKLGENSCQLPAKTEGSFKESTFNWKYLLEGARSIPPKELVLGLNEDNKPAILKSRQDPTYFYILMPILKG